MAAGYSRVMTAVMLPSRTAPDLIAGHWLLVNRLGAVPKAPVWDIEAAVGSWQGGRPKLTEENAEREKGRTSRGSGRP